MFASRPREIFLAWAGDVSGKKELSNKPTHFICDIDFIRYFDYNVINIAKHMDTSGGGVCSTFLSNRRRSGGGFPNAGYKYSARRGAFLARSPLDAHGGFQIMRRNRRTLESKAENMLKQQPII
jgi:hypothetical protein